MTITGSSEMSLFEPALLLGTVAGVSPDKLRINLNKAGRPSSTILSGASYGLGIVGEFVLIEGEDSAIFGRVIETRLPERERLSVEAQIGHELDVHPVGVVQLLATVTLTDLRVKAGVTTYPRLGARVYSAPHRFIATVPHRIHQGAEHPRITLRIGTVKNARNAEIKIPPEKLLGRHCAVLGATGGGKSFTVARLIEECAKNGGKAILLDPSGEYYQLGTKVQHVYVGPKPEKPASSTECVIPYLSFTEGDFVALFHPAGRVQGPKLRSAIRSLRLAEIQKSIATDGLLVRADKLKASILAAEAGAGTADKLELPTTPFNVFKLGRQIREECVFENAKIKAASGYGLVDDTTKWGSYDDSTYSYCLTLVSRINSVIGAPELQCIFRPEGKTSLFDAIEKFLGSKDPVLRISLENISFEFSAREIVANAIGRHLLLAARKGRFRKFPLVVFLDEAHQFLNKTLGVEEFATRLDAFELVAKEGRKYWLNICLATQRPRDIPDGVLSQMGTLIVHRLTNDRDREAVERACGEIDRSASAFLPSLEPGQAAIIGVDIPIPLTVELYPPTEKPDSSGPQYQEFWGKTGT